MNKIILLFSLLLLSQVLAANYAIIHADYDAYVADVQKKLIPLIGNVSLISAQYSTPTAQQLASYDAVLVYSNYAFSDGVALGNILASYVDGGKGVVVAVFSLTNYFASSYPGGRFLGSGNATYYAITPGTRGFGPDLTLVPVDPTHPILNGVKSFDGGADSFRGTGAYAPGAMRVAEWSDKTPLIATRMINNTRRADLNFFPPSSDAYAGFWVSSTDGAKIMANTLQWVTGGGGSCSSYTDCHTCASSSCQWCLDTNKCSEPNLTCPDRVVNPIYCPVPTCTGFKNCSTCLTPDNAKSCSWCLDNNTCVIKNTPCRGELNDGKFCTAQTKFVLS